MIRFIDLRGQDTGYRFAFFSTNIDNFITVDGQAVFDTWDDFVGGMLPGHEIDLDRFRSLCPAWVFAPSSQEEDDFDHIDHIDETIRTLREASPALENLAYALRAANTDTRLIRALTNAVIGLDTLNRKTIADLIDCEKRQPRPSPIIIPPGGEMLQMDPTRTFKIKNGDWNDDADALSHHLFLKEMQNAFKPSPAPWKDYEGNDIFKGDTIQHPNGDRGIVIYEHYAKGDHIRNWRVRYPNGDVLLLANQIGDKGRAVVVKDSHE